MGNFAAQRLTELPQLLQFIFGEVGPGELHPLARTSSTKASIVEIVVDPAGHALVTKCCEPMDDALILRQASQPRTARLRQVFKPALGDPSAPALYGGPFGRAFGL